MSNTSRPKTKHKVPSKKDVIVDKLPLSSRTRNALFDNSIVTLQDYENLSIAERMDLSGFGKLGFIEMEVELKRHD